jgi:hypothetical protein
MTDDSSPRTGNARSLRIAILVFVLGASVFNLLAALGAHADIGPAVAPVPLNLAALDTPAPAATPDYTDYSYQRQLRLHRDTNTRAGEYEITILTVAGVAWYLVSAKEKEKAP